MLVQKALICSIRLENNQFLPVKDDLAVLRGFFVSAVKKTWTWPLRLRADSLWYIQMFTEVAQKDIVHSEEYFAMLHDGQLLRCISSISQCIIRKGGIVTERTTPVIYAWIGTKESELNKSF